MILLLAIVTFILSGKSPWIAHRRVGRYGSDLWVPKIRTMWAARNRFAPLSNLIAIEYIEDETGPKEKSRCDPRVASRFARFCREHSLDELPQLVLVAMGRMSLVGPRPVTRTELAEIYGPCAAEILQVKPGLTGLWQVSGRNRLDPDQRRLLDLRFIRERSFRLYCKILFRTIPEVCSGTNSW